MKILYDPRPRTTEEIFSEEDNARFFSDHEIFQINEDNAEQQYSAWLPEVDIIISQQTLDRSRLESAKVSKRFLTWKQIFYQTSTTPIVQRGRFLF